MNKSLIIFASLMASFSAAAITLPPYFTDNMVLQQGAVVKIPGVATPGKNVTITPSWAKPTTIKADANGNFQFNIATPTAGGPYSLTISDTNETITLSNILSGEVWLCSGQSNMEMPLAGWGKVLDYEHEIAMANNPNVRLLQVKKNTSFAPLTDIEFNGGGWMECNSATVPEFSACAYFYARELADKLGTPIGVIDTTWGGTPAEAWTPFEFVSSVPGFEGEVADLTATNYDADKMAAIYAKRRDAWMDEASKGKANADFSIYNGDADGWGLMPLPANWENTVLPGFDGIVYLQHKLNIPASWAGKPVTLHLGAIDDEDVTYFNGTQIATGSGYSTHRAYPVPADMVKPGEAVISIVVTDTGGEGGLAGNASELYAECEGERVSLVGDWAYTVAVDFSKCPPIPKSIYSSGYPTVLYNAMINPLRDFPIKGCIWYQGCNNVGFDEQYAVLFPQMVRGWRKAFNNPDMPFYFVQLAGYLAPQFCQPDSKWAALRNAQTSLLNLPNTGMATAIDLGNPADIHPKNKQEVARRLSLLALNKTYGKTDIACEAPKCVSHMTKGNKMLLTFDAPLHATSAAALGFIIGDAEGKWQQASASISPDGKVVTLSAPAIARPVAARYDWADYPNGNLYSADALPLAPFATDK